MKTSVVTLQGQDFVLTEPAKQALMVHLKKLQKSTRFRPSSYRDNVEALRDVLIQQGGKHVSKVGITSAIELVGLPEKRSLNDTFQARFPRFYHVVAKMWRPVARLGRLITRHWWQSVAILVAGAAVVLSAGYVFLALMSVQPIDGANSGWQTISTSIGQVRYYDIRTNVASDTPGWLFGWQGNILYAAIFLAIAGIVLRLRQKRRLVYVLTLFGCGFFLLCLHTFQRQITPDYATGRNVSTQTQPLQPRLAYLRQCGDEIPYVFDGDTGGLLFRQLRDEGFQLAVTIPTRESDGTIDTRVLCSQYDALRRDHSRTDIVLQNYTRNEDGSIRPYETSDIGEGISSYGLFVKS